MNVFYKMFGSPQDWQDTFVFVGILAVCGLIWATLDWLKERSRE